MTRTTLGSHVEYGKRIADERAMLVETEIALRAAESALKEAQGRERARLVESGRFKALGSNNDERNALADQMIADATSSERQRAADARDAHDRQKARFDALCDERRGWEWETRQSLHAVLRKAFVISEHRPYEESYDPDRMPWENVGDAAADMGAMEIASALANGGKPLRSTPMPSRAEMLKSRGATIAPPPPPAADLTADDIYGPKPELPF